tara:strand:- start:177 stop:458 length:282 start_codon:yes stop_codon:yes gene_type:complete
MTYNDFMAIAETHYTNHCKERRQWQRIANADYNDDTQTQRANAFKDAQFECMLAIEEMVADTFPRKAKQSADRLLDILCSVDWSETKDNREGA